MSVKFLGASAIEVVSEQQWDAVVRRLGGDATYHSLGYHRASVHLEPAGTVPVLLHHRGEHVESALPLLLRPLPDADGWDATTAYGYGGPVSTTSGEDPAFGAAIDDWAMRNGVVATFIRYHPLLGNHRMGPSPAEVVTRGLTAVWDLAGGTDLLEGMHGHHRRAARKADRAGLEVRITQGPRDLSALSTQYESTMQRLNASDFYFFPDRYWHELASGCSQNLLLVEGVLGDETVASILCLLSDPFLHYHLGASTVRGRSIGASHRLFLATAEWAKAEGLSEFHLGGGLGSSSSSLFTFKRRFDPATEPLRFHVGKWVHDGDRYRALAGRSSTIGHFPSWRHQTSSAQAHRTS